MQLLTKLFSQRTVIVLKIPKRNLIPCLGFGLILLVSCFITIGDCANTVIDTENGVSNPEEHSTSRLSNHPVLIVISFDGFRYDYFNHVATPNLDLLREDGTSVPFMRNQFVTKTFPNHMSIATGLHTESHGVVDNDVFDPLYNRTLEQDSNLYWNYNNDTVPLWTWNELAGSGRKSGVMMWPGSDHPYGVNRTMQFPSRLVKWNESMPFEWRIDRVLEWITDEAEPVNLVFMYFEEPDEFAHAFGPESEQVAEKVVKLDNATGYLVKQLKSKDIFDRVNLMLLSDHGFQQVSARDMINISSIIDPKLYYRHGSTPVTQILPNPGNFDIVYSTLKNASKTMNFTVYSKKELESVSTWFYSHNRRILDIVVVADLGFVFEDFAEKLKYYDSHFNRTPSPDNFYGVHGYDSGLLPMHPFFVAHGPLFKHKFIGDPFDNIDLFPLICKVLGILTPASNGTYAHVKNLIVTPGFAVGSPVGWAIGAGLIFGVMILLGIMSILASSGRQKRRMATTFHAHDSNSAGSYRFINRRNSYDSTDENENVEGQGQLQYCNNREEQYHEDSQPGKEECQALLMSSSTEEV